MQVRVMLPPEAGDLDAHAGLLNRADCGREVAVAGDDHRDVEVPGRIRSTKSSMPRFAFTLPSPYFRCPAHNLEVVTRQERMEVSLVLVVRVEARVRVGAHHIPARRCRLQEEDIVDVARPWRRRRCSPRPEDGDVLAHWYSSAVVLRVRGGPVRLPLGAIRTSRRYLMPDGCPFRPDPAFDALVRRGKPKRSQAGGARVRAGRRLRRRNIPCSVRTEALQEALRHTVRVVVRHRRREVHRADVAHRPRRPERGTANRPWSVSATITLACGR